MPSIFSEVAAMFQLYMYYVSLILIKVLYSSTQFSKCPVSFPIVSVVKLEKEIWVLLEKLAHIERYSVFSIETLCNYT